MIYLFVICVLLCGVIIFISTSYMRERKTLIEMLMAKDYTDYKNYESVNIEPKEHKNMFISRNNKMKSTEE